MLVTVVVMVVMVSRQRVAQVDILAQVVMPIVMAQQVILAQGVVVALLVHSVHPIPAAAAEVVLVY